MKSGSILLLAGLIGFASSLALEKPAPVTCNCESLLNCTCCMTIKNKDPGLANNEVCAKALFSLANRELVYGMNLHGTEYTNRAALVVGNEDLPEFCFNIIKITGLEACFKFAELETTKETLDACIVFEFKWNYGDIYSKRWCFSLG